MILAYEKNTDFSIGFQSIVWYIVSMEWSASASCTVRFCPRDQDFIVLAYMIELQRHFRTRRSNEKWDSQKDKPLST